MSPLEIAGIAGRVRGLLLDAHASCASGGCFALNTLASHLFCKLVYGNLEHCSSMFKQTLELKIQKLPLKFPVQESCLKVSVKDQCLKSFPAARMLALEMFGPPDNSALRRYSSNASFAVRRDTAFRDAASAKPCEVCRIKGGELNGHQYNSVHHLHV